LFFLRGTRAAPILAGISIVVLAMWLVSRSLGLEVIEWLLMKMWAVLAFSVLIIFQPEIRRALAETGTQLMLGQAGSRDMREMLNALLDSTFFLAERRLGALIILQQKIGMRALAETGTILNAPLSQELLTTFFFPNTPLHDGGVIIKDSTVVAAGCIFPLTHDPDMAKSLGTRHRAGVGVTEETDAVAIIVSEETGAISLAHKGRLLRGLNRQRLERHLSNLLLRSKPSGVRSGLSQMLAMFRGPNPPPAEEEVSLL
jgi:diadenylate cyclase